MTHSEPVPIELAQDTKALALFPMTPLNYPLLKSWKASGGRAWNSLISKQLSKIKFECDLIIPVPQQFARSWKMRGGSSHLFSELISHSLGIPKLALMNYEEPSYEKRATLGLFDRMLSQSAFSLGKSVPIKNKHILLTDDFLTSGKTLLDAISLLNQAGAGSVTSLVLASEKASPSTNSAA